MNAINIAFVNNNPKTKPNLSIKNRTIGFNSLALELLIA